MTTIENHSKFQRNKNLLSCNIDGETVLLDMNAGNYLGLNETASKIWDFLETPKTLESLIDNLMLVYEIQEDICENELKIFLADLLEKKIIDFSLA